MNIYRNQRINLSFRPKSKFPRVSDKVIKKLWLDSRGRSGQAFLEIALNLIGDYNFDRTYLKEIDESTFELKTTSGKEIRIQLECGDIDNCPQIKVTEDNFEMSYDYTPISGFSNLLFFDTTQLKDLETGFIQFYHGDYDEVLMKKDNIVSIVYFNNPNTPDSYNEVRSSTFLVSDKLKEAVKQTDSTNVIELYNSIVNNLDDNIRSFEINIYDDKSYKTLDKIIVTNRKLDYILLTKKYDNGSVTLEEDHRDKERFSANIVNVKIDYDDTLKEFDLLKQSLERRLTK